MLNVAVSDRIRLAAWLLVFPACLVAAVIVLPRFDHLHGTTAERYVLFVLLVLPLAGVIGIVRHMRAGLSVRLMLAACYLVAGLVLALPALIFIGCSWAGACF